MKKIFAILLLAIAVAMPHSASAQLRWGPTAGVDFTNLHFKQDLFTIDQTVGATGGVACEMMFHGIGFGLDFGLLYQMRGARLHLGEREMWSWQGYGDERLMLHYVDIPFHLRFKYTRLEGLEEIVAPLVYGGVDFGFLVGHSRCKAIDYTGGQIGLTAGAGVELFKNWQVTASYTWGVTYALKMAILTNDSAQNRTWNLRVAYLF